jgi:aspartyl-tRNA(Asn)/glutamyl-tRNA(Gln) amidotransferase subunit B
VEGGMSETYDQGAGAWEIVIGMEVHAQVLSVSKLFSGAATAFGAEPNAQVSFVDAGMPGMLPVINKFCVEQAVRTGLGLKARINRVSVFDRKNYFYPDLPAGYQISQYKNPIVGEGEVYIDLAGGETVRVGIERLHLEQDAGKSLHDQHPDHSYVDLNRSGIALMEIVTKPDMRSSEEAAAFLRKLRAIVRYLGTCDGNMDEGSMRADVNVSVRKPGGPLGTRCEIKNVNSMRFIAQAVEFEARRQVDLIEAAARSGRRRVCSIRSWARRVPCAPRKKRTTIAIFPIPICCRWSWIRLGSTRSRRPCRNCRTKRRRASCAIYGISAYDAGVLVTERELADYYEDLAQGIDAKSAANWLNNEILGRLNRDGRTIADCPVTAHANNIILKMIADGTISGKIAKDVLDIVWSEGGDPAEVVRTRGLVQVTDTGAIEAAIDAVIAANPDKVEEVKAKPKLGGMVCRSGDETDRRKSESAGRQRAPQGPTRIARGGVIRTFSSS